MSDKSNTVLTVAKLAKIDLTQGKSPAESQESIARFASQFDDIIALMSTLEEVDTTQSEPLYWPLYACPSPLREDAVIRHNTRDDILRNAPEKDGQFFIVPKIV